jgi:hypothetical protein
VAAALERMRAFELEETRVEEAARALAPFARERRSPMPFEKTRVVFWSHEEGPTGFGLPLPCEEQVRVAESPVLRPMLRAARGPERYRVLVLTANRVRLYQGDQIGLERMQAKELPPSLQDALGDQLTERSLQFHSAGPRGRRPTYHGQGGAARGREIDLQRFYHRVARALEVILADDPVPLVLAADAEHRTGLESALHRDVGLLAKGLRGNPEHRTTASLHQACWPIVMDSLPDPREELERVGASGSELIDRLSTVVSQTVMGRVRRLWVPERGTIPACIDEGTGRAAVGWGDDDLVESLATHVIRRGGEVLVVPDATLGEGGEGIVAERR